VFYQGHNYKIIGEFFLASEIKIGFYLEEFQRLRDFGFMGGYDQR